MTGMVIRNKTLLSPGLAKSLGVKEAWMLVNLISQDWPKDAEDPKSGWIRCAQRDIERTTGLDPFQQIRVMARLIKAGFVSLEIRPARPPERWLKIEWDNLEESISKKAVRELGELVRMNQQFDKDTSQRL
jgi:hypothetical protein